MLKHNKTTEVAKAYLEYLYLDEGQEIAAKNYYRPINETIAAKYADTFKKLDLLTIDGDFGGWKAAQEKHFNAGGISKKFTRQARNDR